MRTGINYLLLVFVSSHSFSMSESSSLIEIEDMSDVDSSSDDPWIVAPSFQASLEPHSINPWDQPPFLKYINKMLGSITTSTSILLQGCVDETDGYIYHILNEKHQQVLNAKCQFNQYDSDFVFNSDKKKFSNGSCTIISVLDDEEVEKMRVFLKSSLISGNEVRVEAPPGVTIGWIKRKRFRREYKIYSSANPKKLELFVAKTKIVDKEVSSMLSGEVGDEDYVVVEEGDPRSVAGYLFTSVNFHESESREDLLACTFSKELPNMSKVLIFACLLLVDSEMFAN